MCGPEASCWRWQMGVGPRRSFGGVMLGVWAGLGSPGPGRSGRAEPPASEEEEGRLAPGPRGSGMRRAGALVRESRVQWCPQPLGPAGGPRSRPRSGPACLAGEATGSAESTPAHTLPRACSVRAWELPAESRAALAPSPRPLLAKLGAVGAGVGGAAPACRPLASRFRAAPLPGPRRFSLPPPPRLGTEARMSSPLPEARSQAGWPEAWWCGRLPGGPAPGALSARTDPVQ